jgi:hypothetical protein
MAENQGMGLVKSLWRKVSCTRIPMDLFAVPLLGLVAYLLFSHAQALTPWEGTLLIMAAAALLIAGLHWWDWHQRLTRDGWLEGWVQRTLEGGREPSRVPEGIPGPESQMAMALNAVILDARSKNSELDGLRQAMARDWQELDALLQAIQCEHEAEVNLRLDGSTRLADLGRGLKTALEKTLRLEQIELNYRLRADHSRLQGQAFQSTLELLRTGLDEFENLLEELQETFPRLRREEDALGRLADSGLRHGARLALSVKGLVAQTSRLMEESQVRTEWLRKLRQSADGVRDQTEALARRLDSFRDEAQARIHSFGGAQGSLQELDHVAQQTGLLAVNAAILAQQDGGSTGLAAIGGRLRYLADRTAEGAAGMASTLEDYQRGLEHETAGLWDLREVAQKLIAEVQELLKTAGHLDLHGRDLERTLEAHLGLVDQVRQASERAELSLHEVGARAVALEAAHGRQWSVEAKITPEQDRLARLGSRLTEVGGELARVSQQNSDEIWDILASHQELRRTAAYRQVTSTDLARLMTMPGGAASPWKGLSWARDQRRVRLLEGRNTACLPQGRPAADGGLRLLLLGQDALRRPEPSALEHWSCDPTGQTWDLQLLTSLRTESHRLALLTLLKDSPLSASFPGLDMHIAPEGVQLRLPHPYPGLPAFLAGLRLDLSIEPELWDHPFREAALLAPEVQRLLWLGPGQGGGVQSQCLRLAHAWVRDHHQHERFLTWLPYQGEHPRCPWCGNSPPDQKWATLLSLRFLGLGADPSSLHALGDRFREAGASEGIGGAALCAVGIGHPHPEALLLSLFRPDLDLAGAFHPDLVPYQMRLRDEVLGAASGDSYGAGWSLLEDLQREGWLLPLPLGDSL